MNKKTMLGAVAAGALFFTSSLWALSFDEPITQTIKITQTQQYLLKRFAKPTKDIVLMNIKLTPGEQETLLNFRPRLSNQMKMIKNDLPSAMDLGMNDIPVLDQGRHGSCATFAITGALDALLKKGDYVSQLCHLELGSYLENKSYMPSGWNGAWGNQVIEQIMRFGIVTKSKQQKFSCAGVFNYPLEDGASTGTPMTLTEYSEISENVNAKLNPIYHLNYSQRLDEDFYDAEAAEVLLSNIKLSINRGHRLTFAMALLLSPNCSVGACASYHMDQDTWAWTNDIAKPPYSVAAHELIIFGYDDEAQAIDNDGLVHQGLLLLRNSWGKEAGDVGNYYMTYDYFQKFVLEVAEFVEID